MADQTTDQAQPVSQALAEPTVHVRHGWVAGLGLASLGMWMASYTPLQVLLPTQLQNIDPHGKIVALAVVTGFGAIASGIATPLAGALSDNTTSRYAFWRMASRRHRWTLGMAVLAALSLVLVSQMRTVLGVTILWVLFSAFQNGEYASLSAAIPDHVPVRQRATVAGWVGMPQALGLVVGTILVVAVFTGQTSGYVVLAVLMAVLVLPFVLLTPDYPLGSKDRKPFSWRELGRSYWISPREYPDFAWAWITRFLMSLAIAMGTLYLLYFLRDKIHYARLFPGQDAQDGLLILIVIYTAGVVITAIVGGMISDRLGRRKTMVLISGIVIAAAAAAAHVRGDLDRLDRCRGPVRRRLRRLPGRGPGADHPGAADGQGPGQGPRSDQHRPGLPVGHRGADRRAAGVARRLPDAVRWHRGRRGPRLGAGLEDQERALTVRPSRLAAPGSGGGCGRPGRAGGPARPACPRRPTPRPPRRTSRR